eukprot:1277580-Pyramimonas_sp.AAC.1
MGDTPDISLPVPRCSGLFLLLRAPLPAEARPEPGAGGCRPDLSGCCSACGGGGPSASRAQALSSASAVMHFGVPSGQLALTG